MQQPDCGEWSDAEYTSGMSESSAATFDEVIVKTNGDDALWMDELQISASVDISADFNVCDDSGDCHWGRDGGKGWCESTDDDDWDSAWKNYVDTDFGCHSCIKFKVGDGSGWSCD